MQEPHILIVGQSHTGAITEHLAKHPDTNVEVINFNSPDFRHEAPDGRILARGEFDISIISSKRAEVIISMIGGNLHNAFGLIENPVPFDFMDVKMTAEDVDLNRQYIPYSIMLEHFQALVHKAMLQWLLDIKRFATVPFFHVCSPPPNPDATFIMQHPGSAFREKVGSGISPAPLRRRLYELHTRVVREFCVANNIGFIPPPVEAVSDGYLAKPYWRKDPTHANAEYGQLVLQQIRKIQVPNVASV